MKFRIVFWKLKIKWLVAFIGLSACVERITFELPTTQIITVVQGMISDNPGPYTVNLSKSISLNADSAFTDPIEKAAIKLFDDEGNSESFTETTPGIYATGGVIRGKVGHAYYLAIETLDGKIFKSAPDIINPVGEVDKVNFEFEARTTQLNGAPVRADVFKIFVDANAGAGNNNYVRWRFTGTYKVVTNPELHVTVYPTPPPNIVKSPYPCSGWIVEPAIPGGLLAQVGECSCCTCWVKQYESQPTLSDAQLIKDNRYTKIKVGEVPINGLTFLDKYMVAVEQMSLSENSFNFFKLIRAQKEGASSLFQPPYGQIKGNLTSENSTQPVVGLFSASAVRTKYIFIQKSDLPYVVQPSGTPDPCTLFPNSSLKQPPFWK